MCSLYVWPGCLCESTCILYVCILHVIRGPRWSSEVKVRIQIKYFVAAAAVSNWKCWYFHTNSFSRGFKAHKHTSAHAHILTGFHTCMLTEHDSQQQSQTLSTIWLYEIVHLVVSVSMWFVLYKLIWWTSPCWVCFFLHQFPTSIERTRIRQAQFMLGCILTHHQITNANSKFNMSKWNQIKHTTKNTTY